MVGEISNESWYPFKTQTFMSVLYMGLSSNGLGHAAVNRSIGVRVPADPLH